MINSGLVSITFREKNPEEIIAMVEKAGLSAIEWGGDVHVPHGNVAQAKKVGIMTRQAGLEVAAYGSYYRTGCKQGDIDCSFSEVLETASALGAPVIRVWAGNKSSAEADKSWWEKVIKDTKRIATAAEKEEIKIVFEYHGGTLTDTNESAVKLLQRIDHPNVGTYWQPPNNKSRDYCLQGLENVLDLLENVHVFYWEDHQRLSLSEGEKDWKIYFAKMAASNRDHYALLEFVKNDSEEQFFADASTLQRLIKN
ncbi:MAG: sugar phosphate isomerase/epimerase family protein [Halanaerobiaceae bacterium]